MQSYRFLKRGPTNWAYLIIVVFWSFLIGSGILIYTKEVINQMATLLQFPEIETINWKIYKDEEVRAKIKEENYTVLKEGICGEILAVKYGSLKVGEERKPKIWESQSIIKAVIFGKENGNFRIIFKLDQRGMRGPAGKILIPQGEAIYGYGFSFEELGKNWFFRIVRLDKEGKGVSEAAGLNWDSEKCTYKFGVGENLIKGLMEEIKWR